MSEIRALADRVLTGQTTPEDRARLYTLLREIGFSHAAACDPPTWDDVSEERQVERRRHYVAGCWAQMRELVAAIESGAEVDTEAAALRLMRLRGGR